ncbi:putative fluoride ion transporter CrcB [Lentilactobacillus fungorum]|uniref:Fluoride-specific ion channel FluC n=1 Tax=Lentilactobacillus fungorum TaxID=2201250 RepID=A0ABQ3W2G7_9LACO|nr:CrcB family protein [Lentilactobacillus fungorum]GHP14471.1 putative fluoride ion transporter CrcB [Lentilactobacillus fungorum]
MHLNWNKLSQVTAVFSGGMLGGGLRYEVGNWLNVNTLTSTTLANVIGCFCLTFTIYGLDLVIDLPEWLILGFGTGVVGAFTTFSTFALLFMQQVFQHPTQTWLFLLLNLVGGFITALIGYLAARLMDRGKGIW